MGRRSYCISHDQMTPASWKVGINIKGIESCVVMVRVDTP